MERIKFLGLILLMMLLAPVQASASSVTNGLPPEILAQPSQNPVSVTPSLSTLITPQNVPFEECTKVFNVNTNNLFYLAFASINANRFEIREFQSKTGYILFAAVGKEFLASVIEIDKNRSMLKITPANNNYFFAPGIVLNVYKYIDLNAGFDLENVPRAI